MPVDIFGRHEPFGAGGLHRVEIHPQPPRQTPGRRGGRHRPAAPPLDRIGLSRLERRARRGIYRNRRLEIGGRLFRFAPPEDDQHGPHLDRIAGRNANLGDGAAIGGRDGGHRLVGLHLQQGVAFRDAIARLDENLHDFPLVNPFSEIRQLEFERHGRSSYPSASRRRAAAATRSGWGR